ncbi:hypothetical protein [Lysobacter gummosus]|uniref:hypothetical protein n=1 Tax=Lysobacter gummosus TaxID=262324 RepID=UPI003633EA31
MAMAKVVSMSVGRLGWSGSPGSRRPVAGAAPATGSASAAPATAPGPPPSVCNASRRP